MNNPATDVDFRTTDYVATGDSAVRDFKSATESNGGTQMAREERSAPLFNEQEVNQLRTRWNDVQASFVDEPRSAVTEGDKLVESAMHRLSEIFTSERTKLEQQWDRGGDVSTEDLRQALQRYRSFFNRLLSV
jgi:flagellar biosynthesis GTPase FlhF